MFQINKQFEQFSHQDLLTTWRGRTETKCLFSNLHTIQNKLKSKVNLLKTVFHNTISSQLFNSFKYFFASENIYFLLLKVTMATGQVVSEVGESF